MVFRITAFFGTSWLFEPFRGVWFYAKAVKFGVKMATKPEETAKEPVFNVKMPKKTPNRTPEQDRITKILQNIDRYNGTSSGQVKVEVER